MCRPVTAHEIEGINEEIDQLIAGNGEGLALMGRFCEIAREQSRWQWVVHGDTAAYRVQITKWLCQNRKWKQARRFCLCGRGDQLGVEVGGAGVRVRAHGCGARYCPRCSRKAGRRALRLCMDRLSQVSHGELIHVVFTQRVHPLEPLEETKKRFETAWKKCLRSMTRSGLVGGLLTFHCVARPGGGWHWHAHVIGELSDGLTAESFLPLADAAWRKAKGEAGSKDRSIFGRTIAGPGDAFSGLRGDGQSEFWSESASEIERALQYVVRDVLQGVEKWIKELRSERETEAFAKTVQHTKMHRMFGAWRTKLPQSEAAKSLDSDGGASTAPPKNAGKTVWEIVGTLDQILWQAHMGINHSRDLVKRLVLANSNRTFFAKRLLAVARSQLPSPEQ